MNYFEADIIESIQSLSTGFLDGFFNVVTLLGSVWAIIVFAILFLVLFGFRGTARYLFILGATSFCGTLIKIITARPRPFAFSLEVEDKSGIGNGGGFFNEFSFISGHTLTMVITALSLYFMISRILRDTKTSDDPERIKKSQRKKFWVKALLFGMLSMLTLLVAFSRIYLGAHYISDVLFALLLGVVFYYLFAFLYDRFLEKLIFKRGKHAN